MVVTAVGVPLAFSGQRLGMLLVFYDKQNNPHIKELASLKCYVCQGLRNLSNTSLRKVSGKMPLVHYSKHGRRMTCLNQYCPQQSYYISQTVINSFQRTRI